MNATELRLPQLGHPCLFWWDLAASAMQTFCTASKIVTAYIDKIGQATVAALVYPMVSSSELWGLTPRSGWPAAQAMGAMQARQESLAVVGPAVHPDPMPAEPTPTPTPTSPSPDPAVPEIEDPPAVEVPMPQHVTPVMPTPKADAVPIGNAEADAAASEASSSETAAGAAAPLSKPALVQAPQGEDGPLVSEADPTSNAG